MINQTVFKLPIGAFVSAFIGLAFLTVAPPTYGQKASPAKPEVELNRYFTAFVEQMSDGDVSDSASVLTENAVSAMVAIYPSADAIAKFTNIQSTCKNAETDPMIDCMRVFSETLLAALPEFPNELPNLVDAAINGLNGTGAIETTGGELEQETESAAIGGSPLTKPKPSHSSKDQELEIVFWESIVASTDPDEYQAYLDQYPEGMFQDLARLRVTRFSR